MFFESCIFFFCCWQVRCHKSKLMATMPTQIYWADMHVGGGEGGWVWLHQGVLCTLDPQICFKFSSGLDFQLTCQEQDRGDTLECPDLRSTHVCRAWMGNLKIVGSRFWISDSSKSLLRKMHPSSSLQLKNLDVSKHKHCFARDIMPNKTTFASVQQRFLF